MTNLSEPEESNNTKVEEVGKSGQPLLPPPPWPGRKTDAEPLDFSDFLNERSGVVLDKK
jgi:hypothetical protein